MLLLLAPADAAVAQHEEPRHLPAVEQDRAALPAVEPARHFSEEMLSTASFFDPPATAVEWDEALERKLRDLAWRVGPFRLTPYGAFWADAIYATRRTVPGAYTLWVASGEEEGEPAFTIDSRRTRLGLRLDGPSLPVLEGSQSSALVEIDFHGNFVTENRASVLLRHAYWEVHNRSWRLLVGQTWDVISPLQPGMVDYAVGWTAGNIGFRRTQFRLEWTRPIHHDARLLVQSSLNQDIVTDFPAEPGVERESSSWPVVEARVAVESTDGEYPASWSGAAAPPATWQLGLSGHVGQTGFDFLDTGPPPRLLPPEDDARFLTWSVNLDARLPLGRRWGVQGEWFLGSNLSAYLGGVGQGVCPCDRVPIRSRGGWLEVWYQWSRQLSLHAGGGLDDPLDRDFQLGRTRNEFVFVNGQLQITRQLTTGLELSFRQTRYRDIRQGLIPPEQLGPTTPGRAVTIDWMLRYGF